MKNLRSLSIAMAVIAAFLMPVPGALAAPTLTSPAGTGYIGGVELTSSSSQLLKTGAGNFTCTFSTLTSSIAVNNEAFAEGSGFLTFGGCSGTVDSLTSGVHLEVLPTGAVKLSTYKITVVAAGVDCVYGTTVIHTKLGTLKGGTPATLSVSAELPLMSGSVFLCMERALWAGSYTVTSPTTLLVN